MDLGLKDRVAIVAAASSGMGKAVATMLAQEGAKVAICARREEGLKATAWEIETETRCRVLPVRADLAQREDVERFVSKTVETFGRVDILVANTGSPRTGRFTEVSDDDWKETSELVLMSAVRLCRGVIPWMKKNGGGRIVFLSSRTVKQPMENLILSNVIRTSVASLSKCLSNELAQDCILVNSVLPGAIHTERSVEMARAQSARAGKSVDQWMEEIIGRIVPLKRYGEPWEVAALVAFLVSDQAAYITGASIAIDGGLVQFIF
jgi:3-oxoacyl-[acyl-carrier protein] reductase